MEMNDCVAPKEIDMSTFFNFVENGMFAESMDTETLDGSGYSDSETFVMMWVSEEHSDMDTAWIYLAIVCDAKKTRYFSLRDKYTLSSNEIIQKIMSLL